jgi:hypothetical protein
MLDILILLAVLAVAFSPMPAAVVSFCAVVAALVVVALRPAGFRWLACADATGCAAFPNGNKHAACGGAHGRSGPAGMVCTGRAGIADCDGCDGRMDCAACLGGSGGRRAAWNPNRRPAPSDN